MTQNMPRFDTLSTGAESLDHLLQGGFPSKQPSFIYGKANAGQTIVAMSTAIQAAKKGGRVVYIDADRSFSNQGLPVEQHLLARIFLLQPEDISEPAKIVEYMDK